MATKSTGKGRGASPERMRELARARVLKRAQQSAEARPSIIAFTEDTLGLALSVPQRTLLKSIYGEPLTADELEVFHRCTGRATYPGHPFPIVTVISGAQSGKDSRVACPVVVYEAIHGGHQQHIAPGDPARVVLVAQNKDAADIAFGLIKAAFERPALTQYVTTKRGRPAIFEEELWLKNGIRIACFPCTKASIRGYRIPVAVMDELAFWKLEGSVDSDVEIQTSISRGQVAFPGSKLVKISTPYMKNGVLFDDLKAYKGTDSPDVLLWQSTSAEMNPLITPDRLAREARTTDPVRYRREYEAVFAEDLSTFLSAAWVEGAVQAGRHELHALEGVKYVMAVDANGGGPDAFTCAVVHVEGRGAARRVVQDVMKGWSKPRSGEVNLEGAVAEIASVAARYHVTTVAGDRYGRGWVREAFQRHGIKYQDAAIKGDYLDRSAAYLEVEPLFAQGLIDLLDHPRLVRELRNLERRPSQGGRDKIEHPRGQHDDYANALALAAAMARGIETSFKPFAQAIPFPSSAERAQAFFERKNNPDPDASGWHWVETPSGRHEAYHDPRGLEAPTTQSFVAICLTCGPDRPSARLPHASDCETWFKQHWIGFPKHQGKPMPPPGARFKVVVHNGPDLRDPSGLAHNVDDVVHRTECQACRIAWKNR